MKIYFANPLKVVIELLILLGDRNIILYNPNLRFLNEIELCRPAKSVSAEMP